MSDVTGLQVSDILGLSEPLTKLIETVSTGMGMLYEPIHLKRRAKARAEEIKLISDAIIANSNLPISYQHGNVGIDSTDVENLMRRMQQRVLQEELTKQQNVDAIVSNAAEELSDKHQVSKEAVDADWATRFINIAKEIRSDDMQHIWGKILAGEIENPGSFSLRTLDCIRNISQAEAMAFQRMAPLLIQSGADVFILSDTELMSQYGVNFEDALLLDECGLMTSRSLLTMNYSLIKGTQSHLYNQKTIAFIEGNTDKKQTVSVGVLLLTKPGRELYKIIAHESNNEYFYRVLEKVFKDNQTKLSITTHHIERIENGMINYSDTTERVFKQTTGAVQK